MAIIDLDSHLRDGWLLDEIYQLEEPFTQYRPRRIGDGKYFYSKFAHQLSPMEDPTANANFKKPVTHQVFYNPEANRRGNEVMRWQQGGYDMEYRMKDNAREGVDLQLIFPTQIDIPSQNPGALGVAVSRCYNNWVHTLVAGYRDQLFPVAMMPAGCPEEMANELRRCARELGSKAAHLVSYHDEGAVGQKKLTQTARYLTIALAFMQATGLAFVFHNGGGGFLGGGNGLNIDLIPKFTVPRVLLIVLTMTASEIGRTIASRLVARR